MCSLQATQAAALHILARRCRYQGFKPNKEKKSFALYQHNKADFRSCGRCSRAGASPAFRYRFFGRRPLVPRRGGGGAGMGGARSPGETTSLVVARVSVDGRTKGDRKGPHPTSQPLPPLRGRRRFPCLLAKNLYLKGKPRPYYTRAWRAASCIVGASPCGCPGGVWLLRGLTRTGKRRPGPFVIQ